VGARAFLILHGWQGSGPDHWQIWLAERLEAAGETVRYPALPEPDRPLLPDWRVALAAELAALEDSRDAIVVSHSLAAILWLHHAAAGGAPAGRALLVAPPSAGAGIPEIANFFPVPLDAGAVAAATTGETRIVCAPEDSYCPEGAHELYARALGLPADLVAGGGHLNTDAGYGPWPAVEAWCYGAKKGVET
jgi:predicted alpha/beta hydrolase family esterase